MMAQLLERLDGCAVLHRTYDLKDMHTQQRPRIAALAQRSQPLQNSLAQFRCCINPTRRGEGRHALLRPVNLFLTYPSIAQGETMNIAQRLAECFSADAEPVENTRR